VSQAPVPLSLKRGGDAFIVEHSGDFVVLASTAPSPPGSTVEATHVGGARSVVVRVKVRGCRRDNLPDGREGFRIDGRFVSLTRSDREILFASPVETDPGSTSET
jgi:phage gp45-like